MACGRTSCNTITILYRLCRLHCQPFIAHKVARQLLACETPVISHPACSTLAAALPVAVISEPRIPMSVVAAVRASLRSRSVCGLPRVARSVLPAWEASQSRRHANSLAPVPDVTPAGVASMTRNLLLDTLSMVCAA